MLLNITIGIVCLLVGALGVYFYYAKQLVQIKSDLAVARSAEVALTQQIQTSEQMREMLETQFKATAGDIFVKSMNQLSEMSGEKLTASGDLISQDMQNTKEQITLAMNKISEVLAVLSDKATTIEGGLESSVEGTRRLNATTDGLAKILSSSQDRGSWGERSVEDILQYLGFVDGVNYSKQSTLGGGERPDFTFFLPNNQKIHMDVKFPFNRYREYVEADNDATRDHAAKEFVKAVKGHITTLTKRSYIDVAGGTLDYLLMFLPNEAIYSFVHTMDPGIVDYAMENKIIMVSPITFYGILSMIHQSVKMFALNENASKVMGLLGEYCGEIDKYEAEVDKIGNALASAQRAYDNVMGVRTRKVAKARAKVDSISLDQGDAQPQLTEATDGS